MPDRSPAALAEQFGLEFRGQGNRSIRAVATLAGAGPDQLSFFANAAYREDLRRTRAGVVVLRADDAADCPVDALLHDEPYVAYARIAALFDTRPRPDAGIHPSAVVADDVQLGDGVHVGAQAVVERGCRIGDGAAIGAGSVVGPACRVGAGSRLVARVVLADGIELGERVLVHPGAVIGADGFGIALAGDHWEKVPQLGGVRIGDDCEIGANSTIDRGAIEDTVLEEDVRIDNLVQIGHNVRIGAHSALAGGVLVAGSSRIGRYCLLAGGAGVSGHLEIADRVTVLGFASVTRSITEPGSTWSSMWPARPVREWNRAVARLRRLDRGGRS